MIVDIMGKKQIQDLIFKHTEKSMEIYYKEIDKLRKRTDRLEEEVKILSKLVAKK